MRALILSILIFALSFGNAYAKEILIEASGDYFMDLRLDETFASGTARAREEAKRNAAEKAGVYVESYSKTVDLVLDYDEVKTVAAQLLKIQDEKVTSESAGDNLLRIIVKIQAIVNDEINDARLQSLMNNKAQLEEATRKNNELQRQYDELKQQMEDLKQQYNSSSDQQRTEIKMAVAQNSKYFNAMQELEQGNNFYLRREYQKAIEAYTRAINLNPNLAEAYNNRGNAYVELQQYQSALQDLQTAIKMVDVDARMHNNLGNVYLYLNQYGAAINEYTQAIKLNPVQAITYYNRSLAYCYQGNFQAALPDVQQAMKLNPADADAKDLYEKIMRKLN